MNVDLTQMKAGQHGLIVSLNSGRGMILKLESLGIRVGIRITKISNQIMRGPVTIKVGNTHVALGFGMARKVIVKIDE